MPKVIVAGSANFDIVATAPRHPRGGETVTASSLATFVGGKGVNQAVAAARLGAHTVLIATIGTDPAGDEIAAFLDRENIDVSHLRRTDAVRTGTAFITIAEDNNAMVVSLGANMQTSPTQIDLVPVARGDICLVQLEITQDAVRAFLQRARAVGARTILNAAPVKPCAPEIFDLADIVVVNEEEAAYFGSLGNETVVTTLGAHGAIARTPDGTIEVPGHAVAVVDTTGAGDAFCGAFAASLAGGSSVEAALGRANSAAAYCVTKMGASSSPTSEQL